MNTVLQKLRTITLSNIHSLLNAAIDLNSIGALEQHVRDLRSARDMLDNQAATHRSRVNSLPVEIAGLEARHKEADESISLLLSDSDPSNDHHAAPLEAKMVQLETTIADNKVALETAQASLAKFSEAVSKLDVQIASFSGRVEVLRRLENTKTESDRAEKLLSGISIGEGPNVDNIERRLREQADVSAHKLDRSLGRVTEGVGDSSAEATVAARLAKRRAALAPKAS